MKFAVRYQSHGGNTRAVAEIIAAVLGVEAKPVSVPLEEPAQILFLGGGVYAWHADRALSAFMRRLEPGAAERVVAFSTTGSLDRTNAAILEAMEKKGIPAESGLCLKLGLQGNAIVGRKGGRLTGEQTAAVETFARAYLEQE